MQHRRPAPVKSPFLRRPAVALTALATAVAVAAGVVVAVATTHSQGRPGVRDAAAATTVGDAHAIAARYGHRVEVASLDAAESTTYANPDGTDTAELSTTPIRIRQGGGWVAPDSTLAAAKNGTLAPRAAASPVVLGAAGSHDVLTVPMGAGSVVYTWPTPLPKPTFSGSVATYAEVAPGIDLRVDVGVEASHVSAVIKRRPTTPLRSVDLGLRLTGLTATQDAGGSLTYFDAAGKVAGTSSTPLAWDSTVVPHLGGSLMVPLASSLQRVGSWAAKPAAAAEAQTRLAVQHLILPIGWLDKPSTKYPVTVDPPAAPGEANYTYVDSAYPTASYTQNTDPTDENGGHVHVGLSPGPGGQITRGLFRFNPPTSPSLVGKSIQTAVLATTGVWSWNCTPTGSTIAYGTAEWASSAVTWNTKPAILTTSPQPTASWAAGWDSSCPIKASVPSFNVLAAFKAQNTAAYSHYNFELVSNSEGDYHAWHKFSQTATLSITYDSPPSTPTASRFLQPSAACQTSSASAPAFNNAAQALTIQSSLADADGGGLRWDVTVVNAYTSATVASLTTTTFSAPGSRQLSMPQHAAYLPDGGLYAWKGRSYDNSLYSGYSAYCFFRIDNSGPAKPQIWAGGAQAKSPTSLPVGTAQTQALTFKPGATGDQVSNYVYSFGQTTPVMAPTGQSGSFVPVQGRLINTLATSGQYITPFPGNAWRSVQATGNFGIPSGISAVQISVHALNAPGAGYISLAPDGPSPTHTTSALNYQAGEIVSNTAIVAVAPNGKFDVFTTVTTDVQIDVEGYYTSPSSSTSGLHAMTAVRVASTVNGTGIAQARLAPGSTAVIDLSNALPAGVDASAVFVNIAALSYNANDVGWLTVFPTGSTRPATSINFPGAHTFAMGTVADLNDATQKLSIYVGGTTQPVDLIVDLQAYFAADPAQSQVGEFTPANARVYDSRDVPHTAIAANTTVKLAVAGTAGGGVPSGATAYFLNMTVITAAGSASGYLNAWKYDASSTTQPPTSLINYAPGEVRSNTTVVAADANGQIYVRNNSGTAVNVIIDVQGWYSDNTGYTTVAAASNQAAVTITFDNGVHTLSVWALDSTGNISARTSVVFTVFRDGDPAATGHGWLTDYDPTAVSPPDPPPHPASPPGAVWDSSLNVSGGGLGDTALTLQGGDSTPVLPTFAAEQPLAPVAGPAAGARTVWGLHFNGVDQDATTTDADGSLVDLSDNFTVSAWVNPDSEVASTAVSLDADGGSGFTLGTDDQQHWRFCVATTSVTVIPDANCVTSSSGDFDAQQGPGPDDILAQAGHWYFVMGFYDHLTQTLNLVVSQDGTDTQFFKPVDASGKGTFTTTPTSRDGTQLVLGRDSLAGSGGGSDGNWFAGDIADVSVFQGSRGVPGNDVRIDQLLNMTAPRYVPRPASGS